MARYPKRFKSLRLGFVPLADCAPLVVAQELNIFAKYGLSVTLSRQIGWATVRDKIIYGELDASHAVAGLPFAATLGLGAAPCECLTGLVLNLHGNAITLSSELYDLGVRNAASLRDVIARFRNKRMFVFGIVFPSSSHNFLLRQWLQTGGIDPDHDVRIVVVPPPQMFASLKAGTLDGYCVGEPWNSVAVQARAGWCVATSAELAPLHPEKVLMVRRSFAEQQPEAHRALIAALLEACEYCDREENREQLVSLLARPQYLNASEESLRPGLLGQFGFGHGRVERVPRFNIFHRDDANEPSAQRAAWVLNHMRRSGVDALPDMPASLISQVFCMETYEEARQLINQTPKHEHGTIENPVLVTQA
ncbi:MAG: CmpA/NrtA family ABC transporter substrate-binding protein [Verrucomicrobiota bacterium]